MVNEKQINDLNKYHWFNESDGVSIKICPKFREHIFKIALKKAKTMTNLSKHTKLSKQTLFNQMYGKSMNVKGLKTLLKFTNIDFMEAYDHINEMGWNKFKLPIKLDNKDSAILFAAILGDGSNTTRVMYKNKDKALINKVENSVKQLLNGAIIDRRVSSIGIPYINLPSITGRILNFVGIPSGKQTISNPCVPEVIKESNKSVKKAFIQQFFDDEGWPEPNQMKIATAQGIDCTQELNIEFLNSLKDKRILYLNSIPNEIKDKLKPPKLFIDIKTMLNKDFNIFSSIRLKRLLVYTERATAMFELEIQRKEDVKRFVKEINFSAPRKKEKAEFMINRSREFPLNITLLIINEAIIISGGDGYFLAHEIAKNLGFPQAPIRKRLTTLVKKGVFDKKGEKYFVNVINY
ncbi:MAG: hypothetical protein ABIG93_00865 [archaeon]|nr:hypothetical protein [Nanoarchaeota archaeon]